MGNPCHRNSILKGVDEYSCPILPEYMSGVSKLKTNVLHDILQASLVIPKCVTSSESKVELNDRN